MYLEEYKSLLAQCNLSLSRIKVLGSYDVKLQWLNEVMYQDNLSVESYRKISEVRDWISRVDSYLDDLHFLTELSDYADADIWADACKQLKKMKLQVAALEVECRFVDKEDEMDAVMEIQAGSGGIDARDWSSIMHRMYVKFCLKRNFKVKTVSFNSESIGIRSCTLLISGKYAYGWLKREAGVHRMVRKSPFDNYKRHTAFTSVSIYPDIDEEISVEISPSDLKIDTMKASGAGGQHVNKTESAVRITHIPTGIKVECQTDRSQKRNRDNAMKCLKAKIYKFELEERRKKDLLDRNEKGDITWGTQIRSYVFDKSYVKDLRTGIINRNIADVLEGNIEEFIYGSFDATT